MEAAEAEGGRPSSAVLCPPASSSIPPPPTESSSGAHPSAHALEITEAKKRSFGQQPPFPSPLRQKGVSRSFDGNTSTRDCGIPSRATDAEEKEGGRARTRHHQASAGSVGSGTESMMRQTKMTEVKSSRSVRKGCDNGSQRCNERGARAVKDLEMACAAGVASRDRNHISVRGKSVLQRRGSQQRAEKQGCGSLDDSETFSRLRQCHPDLRDNPNRILEISDMEPRVRNSSITPGQLLFEPDPQVIFFLDFEPFKTYEYVLKLRNRDSVARRVQVLQPEAHEFLILPGKDGLGPATPKVAPGMTACFTVQFNPQVRRDCLSELVVVTERETFVVPVRAISGMGCLDTPERVAFDATPVKLKGEKTLLLRNTGTKAMNFTVHTSAPFTASPRQSFLEVGESVQITFVFEPLRTGKYTSRAVMQTTEGLEFITDLSGEAVNADVRLSASVLKMENTSVQLTDEKKVYLHNNSDHHLEFSWRFLADASPRSAVTSAAPRDPNKTGGCEDDSAQSHSYTGSRAAAWPDIPTCHITPSDGRIWANTSLALAVTFRPMLAVRYKKRAVCTIAGRDTDLTLDIEGTGIGPKARFLDSEVCLGRVVVNTRSTTEFELANQGDIGASFVLRRSEAPMQQRFSFSPEQGHLAVGETIRIKVEFFPLALGAFEETFEWWLEDLPRPLHTTFTGEVLPPSLRFDVASVDFGRISLGFTETRTIVLKNASPARQPFSLRVLGPAVGAQEAETRDASELEVAPVSGVLEANRAQAVSLTLRPGSAKRYELALAVDLGALASGLHTVPVKALCELPAVVFEPDDILLFEEVFVGRRYTKPIVVRNPSPLPARYEVALQESCPSQASLEISDFCGVVEAMDLQSVSVHLTAKKVGHVAATLRLSVAGFAEPLTLRVRATACGPRVRVEPKELDWGKVACLEGACRCVRVTNACPIPAEVTCAIRGKETFFRLRKQALALAPGSSENLEVVGAFCEPVSVQELLVLSVTGGSEIGVTLRGTGTQSPLVFSRDLTLVEFGIMYTNQPKTLSFAVENRGRRSRKLSWRDACKADKKSHPKEEAFTIVPDTVVLDPNASAVFEYRAISQTPGHRSHALVCTELSGFGTKSLPILKSTAKADFFAPSLSFSSSALSFRYVWREGDDVDRMAQEILCTNEAPLPASCAFLASGPFSVSPAKMTLRGKASGSLTIAFNPRFNGRACSRIKERLEVSFEGHAKTESVELRGEVVYPAVEINATEVDFGCVFNETTRCLAIELKNPTELPVVYHWHLTDQYEFQYVSGDNDLPLALVGGPAALPAINKIFDFLPFTGSIEPGQTETICATFFGFPDVRVTATALCVIENGPEFSLRLRGQASLPTFRLSQSDFDFGEVPFNRSAESELTIFNTGLVDVQFGFNLSRLEFPWLVDVSKKSGKVPSRDKQKIGIRFRPGMPMEYYQTIYLDIAHFEPVPISIRGTGTFPSLALNLPRRDEAAHRDRWFQALQDLTTPPAELPPAQLESGDGEQPLQSQKPGDLSSEEDGEREVDRKNVCDFLLSQYLSSASGYALGAKLRTLLEGVRVTAAQYAYDFGSIVLGKSRKKVIRVTNRASTPVSFRTNKRSLMNAGFRVEPETVHRLGPGEEATLSVATAWEKEGAVAAALQLQTAEGPVYAVHLKAMFVVPELELSTDKVDFGSVMRGQRRTVFVRFKNPAAVPVVWRLRERAEKNKKQLGDRLRPFGVEPNQGSLNPGEFLDVKLFFFGESCEREAAAKLLFQLDDNPRWECISVRGRTRVPSLAVSPAGVVEFESALPQQAMKQEIVISNTSGAACEVFAVALDEHEKRLEQILRDFTGYDDRGVAYLPVRKPGRPVWRQVVRRALQLRSSSPASAGPRATGTTAVGGEKADDAPAEADGLQGPARPSSAFGAEGGSLSGEHRCLSSAADAASPRHATALVVTSSPSRLKSDSLPASQRLPADAGPFEWLGAEAAHWSDSDLETEDEAPRPYRVPTEKRVNVLLVGPVATGKTTVAHGLAAQGRRKYLTVDTCIEWMANLERRAAPRKLRNDGEFWTLAEQLRRILEANRDADSEQLAKKGAKGKSKTEKKPEPLPGVSVPSALLAACVRYRVAMPDCYGGAVFDNCVSNLANVEPAVVAHSIAAGLAREQIVLLLLNFAQQIATDDSSAALHASTPRAAAIAAGVEYYRHLIVLLQDEERSLIERLEALSASEGGAREGLDGPARRGRAIRPPSSPDALPSASPEAASGDGASSASPASSLAPGSRETLSGPPHERPATGCDELNAEQEAERVRRELSGVQTLRQRLEGLLATSTTAQQFVAEQLAAVEKIERAVFAPEAFPSRLVLAQAESDNPGNCVELDAAASPRHDAASGASPQPPTSLDVLAHPQKNAARPPRRSVSSVASPSARHGLASSSSASPPSGASGPPWRPILRTLLASCSTALPDLQRAAAAQVPVAEVPAEPPIPEPEIHEVVHKPPPPPRSPSSLSPLRHFALFLPAAGARPDETSGGSAGAAPPSPGEDAGDSRAAKSGNAKKAKEPSANKGRRKPEKVEEASAAAKSLASEPGFVPTTRWVLGPLDEQRVLIKFCAEKPGTYSSELAFRVVGDSRPLLHVALRAACGLPRISTHPRQLFRNTLKQRPTDKAGLVQKQFVSSEGVFDFGPLLLGRSSATARALYAKMANGDALESSRIPDELQNYCEEISLRNASDFPTTVRCALQSSGLHADAAELGPASRRKGSPKTASASDNPFFVFPSEVVVPRNGAGTIHVWSFPKAEGETRDTLLLSVKENPELTEIPLLARGALPKVSLDSDVIQFGRVLVGQTSTRVLTLKNVSPVPAKWSLLNLDSLQRALKIEPATDGTLAAFEECRLSFSFFAAQQAASLQRKVSIRIADAEGLGVGQETHTLAVEAEAYLIEVLADCGGKGKGLDLGNVRVGDVAEHQVSITNKGKYPIKFAFRVKSEELRSFLNFQGSPDELKPGEHRRLTVRCAPHCEVNLREAEEVFLDLHDAETGTPLEPPLPPFPLSLHADFNYVSLVPARGINFGPTQSGKTHSLQFEIRNDGRFHFEWQLQDYDQLTHGSPLCADSLARPEGDAGVLPPASLLSAKDTRANKGDGRGGAQAGGAQAPKAPNSKGKPAQGARTQTTAVAQFGPFRISPVKGHLEPGAKVAVEAQYSAQGDANHSLKLALLAQGVKVERGDETVISSLGSLGGYQGESPEAPSGDSRGEKGAEKAGRDGAGSGHGVPVPAAEYVLQAQSCVPAIICDPDWVFEEQFIVSNAEEAAAWAGVREGRMYIVEEDCLSFGPVVASGESTKAGLQERIRIGNPKSVPAEVTLELKPCKETERASLAADADAAFDVQPRHLSLGPYETKSVAICFRPSAIQRYAACFRAFVDRSGSDAASPALAFDVKGEGTLPTVSLEVVAPPSAGAIQRTGPAISGHRASSVAATTPVSAAVCAGDSGFGPAVEMGRVAVGSSATAFCILRNGGTIPATACCESAAADGVLIDVPAFVTLAPGEAKSYGVHVRPQVPGDIEASFRVYTISNPYEDVTCRIHGTCYIEECRWTLAAPGVVPSPPCLSPRQGPSSPTSGVGGFGPGVRGARLSLSLDPTETGHAASTAEGQELGAGKGRAVLDFGDVPLEETVSKVLFLENTTDSCMKFEIAHPLPAELQGAFQVSPVSGVLPARGVQDVTVWFGSKAPLTVSSVPIGCRICRLKEVDPSGAKAGPKAKARGKSALSAGDLDRTEEHCGCLYQVLAGTEVYLPFFVSVNCDARQCELECGDIEFETTKLFKSRKFAFTLVNPAKVTLPFEFHWEDADHLRDEPPFYSLSPRKGVLAPSSRMEIGLTFAPTELRDFQRVLVCSFPTLFATTETRRMAVNASAIRPVCHFDLPPSDYRDRRARTNSAILDPKIQIVEVTSVGIGIRNTKRFFVFNPTTSDFDFEWRPARAPFDAATRASTAESLGARVVAANGAPPAGFSPASASCASAFAAKGGPPLYEGFRLSNSRGRIAAGKRTEVAVEFLPARPGTHESYWTFAIPRKELEQEFLFVGNVKEPHVALDRSSVCFHPVLLGAKAEEIVKIHNREDVPLSFVFDRSQPAAERRPLTTQLSISPASGVLPANSVTPVTLSFKPVDEKPFSLNLLCRVKQKSRQLTLKVKGEGYSVKHNMILLNEDGSLRQFAAGAQTVSLLDFGSLVVGQTKRYTLQLQNGGSFAFSFHWAVQSVSGGAFAPSITVSPRAGVVEQGKNEEIALTYAPTEVCRHEEIMLVCSVSGSEPYRIRVQGSCASPKVSFSFSAHDFGTFVLPPPLAPGLQALLESSDSAESALAFPHASGISDRVELKITNTDTLHDCFISTPFEKSSAVDVQLVPCNIGPGERISVPIVFTPKQARSYKFKIPFSVNERKNAHVTITGKAILARLELTPPSDEIRFAPLIKGESAIKHVKIVNRSEASLDFFLRAAPKLASHGISWKPLSSETRMFSLQPRQELPLEVSFKPAFSMPEFSLPLFAECSVKRGGSTYRFPSFLCNVAAKSFETEVRLSQPSLSFGSIVVNSWATQTVKLTNIGELHMRFRFKNSAKHSRLVSLSPAEGLLQPHADVPIEVTFRPIDATEKEVTVDDICCVIEPATPSSANLEVSSLPLTVTGLGVPQPADSVQTLRFSTAVRMQQTKTFQVKNPKKYDWTITPLVACESPKDAMYFFCSPSGRITIPANQKLTFQVTYKPLALTREPKSERTEGAQPGAEEATGKRQKYERDKAESVAGGGAARDAPHHGKGAGQNPGPLVPCHAASIFIPLPDGAATTCRFIGHATEPIVEHVIEATVRCRQKQLHLINIRNWLPVKQKFDVHYTVIQSTGDAVPQIQAPDRFDLPPSQSREYRFFASAFKACSHVIQFRFTNREKADFYLAEARLTFTEPEAMGAITLDSFVRQLARAKISIENPSTKKVAFQCQSNIPDVFFAPVPFEILPGATGELEVSLRPNLPGTGEGTVALTSDELGTYKYLLKYTAAPVDIDKVATFNAPLGRDVTQTLRFLHFAKKAAVYHATLDTPPDDGKGLSRGKPNANLENFSLDTKSVSAAADLENKGVEFPVTVRFTPSKLAETKATLVLRSPEGFEYKALLVGRAQPPQPQGPFHQGKGKAINIDFKNPFDAQTEFTFQVDHPCFAVEKKTARLDPKKSMTIAVAVKPDSHEAGRLIVTAEGTPPWIFYLKAG
ncbi:hypothetical protein BESB_056510 [Besnoitia besnoiti]|uniref:MSP domain-containing protein n=1 Tax=Besnoitia besnoiti TaxID=94643 RepID=A0A2A9MKN9_BESBE|nr:hypothetical protein BESB_056510 [Besnoitia besnoiti]PFH36000.1 hypothetical protein BESB_056510 [Besnoitia besnoiti]